jgi:hypothetical protein
MIPSDQPRCVWSRIAAQAGIVRADPTKSCPSWHLGGLIENVAQGVQTIMLTNGTTMTEVHLFCFLEATL